MELKNKVVLITGSSRGIGRATAVEFAKKGSNVVLTYHTDKKNGEEVFNECNKLTECILIHLDVTDENSIKNCVEKAIDKFGAIDILVNNAGVISWKELSMHSFSEIDEQIDVNLIGLIKMTKEVLPYFKGQSGGMIINISSGAGKTGFSGLSVYCATKFGVRGFSQSLSKELGDIRVLTVNPRTTATEMTNYKGDSVKSVAEIIVKAAQEKIKPDSNGDVDVWKYL